MTKYVLLAVLLFADFISATDFARLGKECSDSTECYEDPAFELCGDESKCVHKSIFPLLPLEIAGFIITILALLFANSGGLGGGGIMIPVLLVFFGFDIKSAIGISNATIFVSAVCRYLQNLPKSHPRKDGTGVLVDYNVAIVMLPSIVLGVIAGGIVNSVFPSIYLAVGLVLLLVFIIASTWRKLCLI